MIRQRTLQLAIEATARTGGEPAQGPRERSPRALIWTAGCVIGGLVGGAIYLLAVRGDALLLDLSALSKYVFCF